MYGPLFSLVEKPVFKEDVDKHGGSNNFSAVGRKFSSSCTEECQNSVLIRYLPTRTSDLNVRLD